MTVVQYHYPPLWEEGVLLGIRAPVNHESKRFLTAWGTEEGGFAKWNPLNTTFPSLPGSTNYNSIGVKNYSRPAWGVAATIIALTSPAIGPLSFGMIVGHLQDGGFTAEEIVEACRTQISEWGTNPDHILKILSELP